MILTFNDWNNKKLYRRKERMEFGADYFRMIRHHGSFSEFLNETSKGKDSVYQTSTIPQYATGFIYLDYSTGAYITVSDNDVPIYQYHNIGIPAGSVIVNIAKAQGGKSTSAVQMGAGAIELYINRMIYEASMRDLVITKELKQLPPVTGIPFIQVCDTEKTYSMDYAAKITHYKNSMCKKHLVITPITTDKDLMRVIEKHVQYKLQTMGNVMFPMLDMFGEPISTLPPTFLVIDSTTQLLLEDCDDPETIQRARDGTLKVDKNIITNIYDSAVQNTAGARRAKIISALYSQLVNIAKKYNIIIFSISHINKSLPINGIPTKQYRGLRAGETISGGERAIFLAANILRFDVIKAVGWRKSTELNLGEGVTGFVSLASWIKSKSNSKNGATQMVYTNAGGYDRLLSTIYTDISNGELEKKGNFYTVPGHDQRFTLKTANEVFGDNPELFSAYYDDVRDRAAKLLDNPERAYERNARMLTKLREDNHNEYSDGDRETRSNMMDIDDILKMGLVNAS